MNDATNTPKLNSIQEIFCKKHIKNFSVNKWEISIAGNAGSDRRFIRLRPFENKTKSTILILWTSDDGDWKRFLTINQEISSILPILPKIYATDEINGFILEEDCGYNTVKDYCMQKVNGPNILETYKKVLDSLIKWQNIDLTENSMISTRRLDREMLLWETDYFATHCVKEFFNLENLITPKWEQERQALATNVSALPLVCLHRDFQSENVLLHNNEIKFVDYQGARLGPAEYDLASLLFDPYATFLNTEMRYLLLDYYRNKSKTELTKHTFHIAAIQRLVQALGAYGNLSLNKNKLRYKQYIPIALKLLLNILETEDNYPEFKNIVGECIKKSSKI